MKNDIENLKDECPTPETLRRFAEDFGGDGMEDVAAHLFVCARCRRMFEEIIYPPEGFSLTDDELRTIDEFVRARCTKYNPFRRLRAWILMHPPVPRPSGTAMGDEVDFRKAAAKDSLRPKAADSETVLLTYVSCSRRTSEMAWRAFLSLPASPSDKTRMELAVMNGDGRPAEGVFVVAGVRVMLSGGRGEIAYPSFVAGLKDPNVSFELPDGTSSPGTLVLF